MIARETVLVEIGLMRGALRVALSHLSNLEDGLRADRADLASLGRTEFDNAMEMVHRSVCNLEALMPHWRRDQAAAVVAMKDPDGYSEPATGGCSECGLSSGAHKVLCPETIKRLQRRAPDGHLGATE